ncbi:hypothetical protein WA026_002930 [Henosepilachna vigintioctopunctata]|uniref:Gustatory receptor n=1 Tax=Henosepilachna vigintioctopunctata TaxID=420089 RepID=A0AAW1TM01_9CUCU
MFIKNEVFILYALRISNYFLILPPLRNAQNATKKLFEVFSPMYITLSSVLAVFIEIEIIRLESNDAEGVLDVLLHLLRISLQISTAVISVRSTFFIRKKYDAFLVKLWKINSKISWLKSTDLSRTISPYVLFVILAILYTGYETSRTLGFYIYSLHLLEIFQSIQGLIVLTVEISLIRYIRFQFSAITDELLDNQKSSENKQNSNGLNVIEIGMKKPNSCRNMKELIFCHDEVCNLVDSFNSIFGVHLLLAIFLSFIDILIHAGLFSANVFEGSLNKVEERSVINMFLAFDYTIISTIFPIVLAHECSCVVAEGKKLVATCFSCFSRLPLMPRTHEDELFEKSLSVLCRQAEARMPQFTAGGFFTIDYSMLASLVGSLSANMIIILQFMQSNRNGPCDTAN